MVPTFETSREIISHNVINVAITVDIDWKWLLFFALMWVICTKRKRKHKR